MEGFFRELRNLGSDSKLEKLQGDLHTALSARETVVVFSQYGDTLHYLQDRLTPVYGRRVATYTRASGQRSDGTSWRPARKEEVKSAFGASEIQILLGTDAIAELALRNIRPAISQDELSSFVFETPNWLGGSSRIPRSKEPFASLSFQWKVASASILRS